MAKMEYDLATAIKRVEKKGCQVMASNRVIIVKGNVGLKIWGAIDYLCHAHRYNWKKA